MVIQFIIEFLYQKKYNQTINLKDLFKNTKLEEILGFLKETNLFIKI